MSLRARRALAWLLDVAPLWIGAVVAVPAGYGLALLRAEASQGIGLFDPAGGADPARLLVLSSIDALAGPLLGGQAMWLGMALLAIALCGASPGTLAAGLRVVEGADAGRPARPEVLLLRALLRGLLFLAPVLTCVLIGRVPALRAGAHDAAVVGLLGAQLGAVLLEQAVGGLLGLAGARSLADRLLGTGVVRRAA